VTRIVIADELPEEIPELYEGPAMDLPAGAEQQGDGSVRLTLDYPKKLRFKSGDRVREEPIGDLIFHRMTGAEGRKIIGAKNSALVGFSASARVTQARASLILNALDAADGMAASRVVTELLGGPATGGLPDDATSTPEGVRLTLLFPMSDEEGTEYTEFLFPRMTVAQRDQAQASPDVLNFVLGKVTGLTPKAAGEMLDKGDAADLRSVNRVISFLFGLGR
jgi:hypothetical protein